MWGGTEGDTVILGVDYASDAAKLPTRPRMAPSAKSYPAQHVNMSAGKQRPCFCQRIKLLSLISCLHRSVNDFKTLHGSSLNGLKLNYLGTSSGGGW